MPSVCARSEKSFSSTARRLKQVRLFAAIIYRGPLILPCTGNHDTIFFQIPTLAERLQPRRITMNVTCVIDHSLTSV